MCEQTSLELLLPLLDFTPSRFPCSSGRSFVVALRTRPVARTGHDDYSSLCLGCAFRLLCALSQAIMHVGTEGPRSGHTPSLSPVLLQAPGPINAPFKPMATSQTTGQ